ncbi:hypothetical protein MHYP_G00127170 [Metynnis hypsauchen]
MSTPQELQLIPQCSWGVFKKTACEFGQLAVAAYRLGLSQKPPVCRRQGWACIPCGHRILVSVLFFTAVSLNPSLPYREGRVHLMDSIPLASFLMSPVIPPPSCSRLSPRS